MNTRVVTKKAGWVAASMCWVAACTHDFEDLPNPAAQPADAQRDIPAWLSLPEDSVCEECLVSTCVQQAMQCLENAPCRMNLAQCMPPNPGCAQQDVLTREMAVCLTKGCGLQCDLPLHATDCIGSFSWRAPTIPGLVTFAMRLDRFRGFPYEGTANISICWGPTPVCDATKAVALKLGEEADAEYEYSLVDLARPSFRVTGEGLRAMTFYEDANISAGYKVLFPALSESLYSALVGLLQTTQDPTLGTLNIQMFDCNGGFLPGVEFRLEQHGVSLAGAQLGTPYYFDEMIPQPVTVLSKTSTPGMGGFLNIEPGLYNVRAYIGERPVGTIDSIAVQANEVTQVNLMPLSRDEAP